MTPAAFREKNSHTDSRDGRLEAHCPLRGSSSAVLPSAVALTLRRGSGSTQGGNGRSAMLRGRIVIPRAGSISVELGRPRIAGLRSCAGLPPPRQQVRPTRWSDGGGSPEAPTHVPAQRRRPPPPPRRADIPG